MKMIKAAIAAAAVIGTFFFTGCDSAVEGFRTVVLKLVDSEDDPMERERKEMERKAKKIDAELDALDAEIEALEREANDPIKQLKDENERILNGLGN